MRRFRRAAFLERLVPRFSPSTAHLKERTPLRATWSRKHQFVHFLPLQWELHSARYALHLHDQAGGIEGRTRWVRL